MKKNVYISDSPAGIWVKDANSPAGIWVKDANWRRPIVFGEQIKKIADCGMMQYRH